jgi:hypothetical protein
MSITLERTHGIVMTYNAQVGISRTPNIVDEKVLAKVVASKWVSEHSTNGMLPDETVNSPIQSTCGTLVWSE